MPACSYFLFRLGLPQSSIYNDNWQYSNRAPFRMGFLNLHCMFFEHQHARLIKSILECLYCVIHSIIDSVEDGIVILDFFFHCQLGCPYLDWILSLPNTLSICCSPPSQTAATSGSVLDFLLLALFKCTKKNENIRNNACFAEFAYVSLWARWHVCRR
jgi:hypothetical protein